MTPGFVRTAILLAARRSSFYGASSRASGRESVIRRRARRSIHRIPRSTRTSRRSASIFPTDEGWIVLTTPDYPDRQSLIGPDVMRMTDDLAAYLLSRGDAVGGGLRSPAGVSSRLNQMFHNGYPKFFGMPARSQRSTATSGTVHGRHGAGRNGTLLRQQSARDQHLHPRVAAGPHLRHGSTCCATTSRISSMSASHTDPELQERQRAVPGRRRGPLSRRPTTCSTASTSSTSPSCWP